MRNPGKATLVAALITCALSACSGGGGGGGVGTLPQQPPVTPTTAPAAKQNVVFTVLVPAASSSSSSGRRPQYVASSTQSVKIVESDNGAAPGSPVIQNTTSGSPGCTSVSAGLSCSITVAANIGDDTFTITTFDGPNATGNLLSSGTVQGIVQAGVANTFPTTLAGHVASVTMIASEPCPQIGTSTTIAAQAKDADGNTIIGPYDAPVAISTSGAAMLSTAMLYRSSDSATLSLSSSQITAFNVNGSINGVSGSIVITPSSNVVYYSVGSNAIGGAGGFHIKTGNDGFLYYTTIAPAQMFPNGTVASTSSNIGRFDPSSGAFTEIPVNGMATNPIQTPDGAVWIAYPSYDSSGFGTGYLARIAGGFSAANFTPVALPTPNPNRNGSRPRDFAFGADGNVYLTDTNARVLYQVPNAPPVTANITIVPAPKFGAPAGSAYDGATAKAALQGITSASDGNLYIANHAGISPSLLQYNPASRSFANLALPYPAESEETRYVVQGSDGNLYVSSNPSCSIEPCQGGLAQFTLAGASSAIPLPDALSAPDDLAAGNGAIAFVDLGMGGFGTYDLASHELRDYPITQLSNASSLYDQGIAPNPNGVTYANGDVWYISSERVSPNGATAIGHVIVTNAWSVWPGKQISLNGPGQSGEQLIGIMESGNSGPFTLTSSNPAVAALQPITGFSHNFELVGNGPGTCTVTITDAHGRFENIAVGVTTTSGTVQNVRRHSGTSTNGGPI